MTEKDILVTIAIPIYNAKDYLGYSIQSVINQTYSNWELLLMEDGSTDGSAEIAQHYVDIDDRIRFVSDGVNRGLIYRLNESIGMANGEYYARMDADDIMVTTRIEEEVNFLEKHPNVDVVGASIMTIDNNNKIIGSGYNEGEVHSFIHPTVMGRTVWFESNKYADWALRAEDFELWTRTANKSIFHAIGKPLLFYREIGLPAFSKYILSQETLLKIYKRYRNYDKQLKWFLLNTIQTYLKIIVYALFATIGKLDYLVSKRSRKPLPDNLWLTEKDLEDAIRLKA